MTVLEFGAGACWLSRHLNQLGLKTISCDVSPSALARGKELFAQYPLVGSLPAEPQFLLFDGHRFDLPAASVDRIICFDAFHHVPNQETVLREMSRILKPSGVAGFCEPGKNHSQTQDSQEEMRKFRVLENDIDIVKLFGLAEQCGFYDIQLTVMQNMEVRLSDQVEIVSPLWSERLTNLVHGNIRATMSNGHIFFLYNGAVLPDSRKAEGLSYKMTSSLISTTVKAGERLVLPIEVTNTGTARWLSGGTASGSVQIGVSLFDTDGVFHQQDVVRHQFSRAIEPGETVVADIVVAPHRLGRLFYRLDMVSEQVCWMGSLGSDQLDIEVTVVAA
jgi:SAM-dependent methyltransferase